MAKPKPHIIVKYDNETILQEENDFALVSCYKHTKNYGPIGLHSHEFFEINLIIEGTAEHYIGKNRYEAKVGDLFFIPMNTDHGYSSATESSLNVFHLLLSTIFCERYKLELQYLPSFDRIMSLNSQYDEKRQIFKYSLDDYEYKVVSEIMEKLLAAENSDYEGKEIQKIAYAIAFLSSVSKIVHESNHDKYTSPHYAESKILLPAIEYIRNNFDKNISIEYLSSISLMSKSTFLRHFKYVFNCSPKQYILRTRIDNSIKMLCYTNKSISEIAQSCGFFDDSHYCRNFKKLKKISPAAFKKKLRQQRTI